MKISRMSDEEYLGWAPASRAAYAADKMRASGLTKAEAEKVAEEDFKRILPDGRDSQDNFLYTARNDEQTVVGFLWFCVRGANDNRRAFVCDILVKEPFRGRGYGKLLMLHAEKEASDLGLKRIGLHVFGFNETAIGLYQSLGYQTTDLVMEKTL